MDAENEKTFKENSKLKVWKFSEQKLKRLQRWRRVHKKVLKAQKQYPY